MPGARQRKAVGEARQRGVARRVLREAVWWRNSMLQTFVYEDAVRELEREICFQEPNGLPLRHTTRP